jgi:ABC-type transport system involved in Fe-S cluster assembly fused permease/ATPase subunit
MNNNSFKIFISLCIEMMTEKETVDIYKVLNNLSDRIEKIFDVITKMESDIDKLKEIQYDMDDTKLQSLNKSVQTKQLFKDISIGNSDDIMEEIRLRKLELQKNGSVNLLKKK